MSKTDPTGVHLARKRLADGTAKTYYYAWRGGPRINAEPGTEEFARLWKLALQEDMPRPIGTLHDLITEYRLTSEYAGRSYSKKQEYSIYLSVIDKEFGAIAIEALQKSETRERFEKWRESMSEYNREADYAWMLLSRVLFMAKKYGAIAVNVCERSGRFRLDG